MHKRIGKMHLVDFERRGVVRVEEEGRVLGRFF